MVGHRLGAAGRGYDHEWRKVRDAHLALKPWCRACGRRATMVDHIETVRAAPHRRLDPTNLQSLCRACHAKVTKAFDSGSTIGACDVTGRPLDPRHPWADTMVQSQSDVSVEARLKQDYLARTADRRGRGVRRP